MEVRVKNCDERPVELTEIGRFVDKAVGEDVAAILLGGEYVLTDIAPFLNKARLREVRNDGRVVLTIDRGSKKMGMGLWPLFALDDRGSTLAAPYSITGSVRRNLNEQSEKGVEVWELPSGRMKAAIALPSTYDVSGLALSPDGSLLGVGQREGMLSVWNVGKTNRLFELRSGKEGPRKVSFSPSSSQIAACSQGEYFLWELDEGSVVRQETLEGDPYTGEFLRVGRRWFLTWCYDKDAETQYTCLAEVETGRILFRMPMHRVWTCHTWLLADGKRMVIHTYPQSKNWGGDLWVIDIENGMVISHTKDASSRLIKGASCDGAFIWTYDLRGKTDALGEAMGRPGFLGGRLMEGKWPARIWRVDYPELKEEDSATGKK